MKHLFFSFAFFVSGFLIQAQEIKAQVLDFYSHEPVPFATVQYAEHNGVVTNEEGVFSFSRGSNDFSRFKISSVGYATLEKDSKDFTDSVIYLKQEKVQLKDVYLTNKNLSAKEIIERIKNSVQKNYNFDNTQKRFFLRESNFNIVRQFDLHVNESSIPELNQHLMDRIAGNIPKNNDGYKEVLGDFYGNYSQYKVQPIKAANLYNPQSTASLTEVTEKLQEIFKKNVKKSSYLKIKSGIVGFKVDADEFKEETKKDVDTIPKVKTEEEKSKELISGKKYLQNSVRSQINNLFSGMFWKSDTPFDVFEKSRKYNFKVAGYTLVDSAVAYVIEFKPKHGADFEGKIYVNTTDFGVYRLDYQNVKPLKSFSLLGISTKSDVYSGKMIFSKDIQGHYNPKYLEQEKGETVGISRPLTIIEKNKKVVGKRKQNELDMEVNFKISQINKSQFVVYENKDWISGSLEDLNLEADFDYQTFKKYNPDFWTDYNIIEPNAAIKAFTVLDSE